MVKEVGLTPLLNNILVSAVGWMGALAGGAFCAMGGLMMVRSSNLDGVFPLWTAGMYCGLIGFSMCIPAMEVVESMVTALFICYANNPDVMLLNMPELYAEIDLAYNRMIGEQPWNAEDEQAEDGEEWNEEEEAEWNGEDEGEWDEDEGGEWDEDDDWDEEDQYKGNTGSSRPGKKSGAVAAVRVGAAAVVVGVIVGAGAVVVGLAAAFV